MSKVFKKCALLEETDAWLYTEFFDEIFDKNPNMILSDTEKYENVKTSLTKKEFEKTLDLIYDCGENTIYDHMFYHNPPIKYDELRLIVKSKKRTYELKQEINWYFDKEFDEYYLDGSYYTVKVIDNEKEDRNASSHFKNI